MASFVANLNFAKLCYFARAHHARFRLFIDSMPRELTCQDCGGGGGHVEPVLDDGSGPWEECGWCEGTGYVTPWIRGEWLRYKRRRVT